jgi:hypothetical protein
MQRYWFLKQTLHILTLVFNGLRNENSLKCEVRSPEEVNVCWLTPRSGVVEKLLVAQLLILMEPERSLQLTFEVLAATSMKMASLGLIITLMMKVVRSSSVCRYLPDCTVQHPTRLPSTFITGFTRLRHRPDLPSPKHINIPVPSERILLVRRLFLFSVAYLADHTAHRLFINSAIETAT